MQVQMIEGLHLTATNKRHIAEMVSRGMMEAGNKTFQYIICNLDAGIATMTITKRETDDLGRKVARKGHYVVRVSA